MDYLKLTSDEAKYIDSLLAKKLTELTEEELQTVTEYNAAWLAQSKYYEELKAERTRTNQVIEKYDSLLAEESQKKFNEAVESILSNRYILEDD